MTLGIFDSGVGGFSVLKRVIGKFGDIPCIYLGDTARVPYGEKSLDEIRSIAKEIGIWLKEQEVTTVLVACNTTNSLALDVIQSLSGVRVMSLIESAFQMIEVKRVGVLATPATTSSLSYTKRIQMFSPDIFVFEQACPELVPLIESGRVFEPETRKLVSKYLSPLLENDVKAIVLGCSHYPLLEELFIELIPNDVQLIDPAIGLINELSKVIESPNPNTENFVKPLSFSKTRFCVTSNPESFSSRAGYWLGTCPQVELVSLRSKACFF